MSHISPHQLPAYQQFQRLVMGAQQSCDMTPIDAVNIGKTVQTIAIYFRDQILTATTTEDDPHHAIQVEINKQLRLLKTDGLFLRSAKQPTTQEQRLQQMRDRLTLLQRYCEMILAAAD
jgi:hypothetical protein